jgi:hypothetical protein
MPITDLPDELPAEQPDLQLSSEDREIDSDDDDEIEDFRFLLEDIALTGARNEENRECVEDFRTPGGLAVSCNPSNTPSYELHKKCLCDEGKKE